MLLDYEAKHMSSTTLDSPVQKRYGFPSTNARNVHTT
jgi:hypothetical protein